MPADEHDLSHILQQVEQLRQTRADARLTEREYRTVSTQYISSFLNVCGLEQVKPYLFELFGSEPKIYIELEPFYHGLGGYRSEAGNPKPYSYRDIAPFASMFRSPSPSEIESLKESLSIVLCDNPNGGIYLAYEFRSQNVQSDKRIIEYYSRLLRNVSLPDVDKNNSRWFGFFKSLPDREQYRHRSQAVLRKVITSEEFSSLPTSTVFKLMELEDMLRDKISIKESSLKEQSGSMSTVIQSLVNRLKANPYAYSSRELENFAQRVAETTVALEPATQQAISQGVSIEQLTQLIAVMINERLEAYQPDLRRVARPKDFKRQISQITQRDKTMEGVLDRFIRRSKDPERVLEALIALSTLIPGVKQFSAIIEVINIMFGPNEEN